MIHFPLSPSQSTLLNRTCRVAALLLFGLFSCLSAHAAIFNVGPLANGCSHSTIAAAVTAAETNPGADTIRITRSLLYNQQAIVISTAQNLNVVGGFAGCTSTVSDAEQTILDGSGGAAVAVLRVNANTPDTVIKLRLLRITGGDSNGDGGGIAFTGPGILELIETTIINNDADAGGGIHVRGSSSNTTELRISNDNLIAVNHARSGGGIYLEQAELLMQAPGSSIYANTATETGGGLRLYSTVSGVGGAYASIGSTGYSTLAAIEGNTAAVGGGAAMFGNANLLLDAPSASAPVVVRENFASQRGGAIDLQPLEGVNAAATGAELFNAVLDGNAAPTGAAVYASNDTFLGATDGSFVSVTDSRVTGSVSETVANVPTDGPIVVVTENSTFLAERSVLSGNHGGPLVRSGSAGGMAVEDSLITGNTVREGVLSFAGTYPFGHFVQGVTIVGNTIESGEVIVAADGITLRNSIVWQPGTVTLQATSRFVDDVLASEIASLGSSASIISAEPRFIDPEIGDYRLQAASSAIDFSGADLGDGLDLDGAVRGIDLARVTNFSGGIDLGAFERQALGNLVLNPGFLGDRRLWDNGSAGATATWVANGANSPGSVTVSQVSAPGGSLIGLRQCVRIPGPGGYRLKGFAYGIGADSLSRDRVSLSWTLRYDTGGESCSGPISNQGTAQFNNTATWGALPASSGAIYVPPDQWTPFTNVELQLVVTEGSLNINATTTGHFDDIGLEADDVVGDVIFADGFDP